MKRHFQKERCTGSYIVLFLTIIFVCVQIAEARFLDSETLKRPPHIRIGCHPSPTFRTDYPTTDDLGRHGYGATYYEKDGIVYTSRGGHIDLTHTRIVIDWTAYLAEKTKTNLLENNTSFEYKRDEPCIYTVYITYPKGWTYINEENRERIATEIAIGVGQYLAYIGSTWHEIATWFGYKSHGIISEYMSSFSWEDNYSNLLGAIVGARALRDEEHPFCQAVDIALKDELEELGLQPIQVAQQASEEVEGIWFAGNYLLVNMIKRNLDIGFSDGYVTPWLVTTVECSQGQMPTSYRIPNLGFVLKYGFSIRVEMTPGEWEKAEILKAAYPDKRLRRNVIEPDIHFPLIMDFITAQAVERYGPEVNIPYSEQLPQPQAVISQKFTTQTENSIYTSLFH